MKPLGFLYDIISWGFFFIVILLAFFTITSNTSIVGGYKSFLVLSGSMEPTINTGDIVIVHNDSNYYIKDVITFIEKDGRIVTHRIVKAQEAQGSRSFETKGDANRSGDEAAVDIKNVLGRVIFVVPKLGFLVGFAKTLPGFLLFIIFPGLLLISNELLGFIKKSPRDS